VLLLDAMSAARGPLPVAGENGRACTVIKLTDKLAARRHSAVYKYRTNRIGK